MKSSGARRYFTQLDSPLGWSKSFKLKPKVVYMNPEGVKTAHLKQIARLSRKSLAQLRKLNNERAFYDRKLSKYELIYQIVFFRDAP